MAQLLPIVRKFFPCGMVDGLLTVCVLLNLALMMAMSSDMASLLPRRALKFKTNFQRQPNPGRLAVLLGACGKASLNTRTELL
jgi:hypothetical protein